MSWAELTRGGAVRSRPSDLDSKRFGCNVSRVTVPSSADVPVEDLLAAVEEQAADVCVVRYPARHQTWFSALSATGAEVNLADTLDYWSLVVGSGRPPPPDAAAVLSSAATREQVDVLVADVFTGYGSHYLASPLFQRDLVLEGYQEWARASAASGDLLVLSVEDVPAGFATLEDSTEVSEILLAGIVPARQGEGWYAHLLAGVERRAAEQGTGTVVISTQGHNMNVQKAWARYGFEPAECFVTAHVMRRG